MGFDGFGTAIIPVHTHVGDVAVVPDPVHELPTAEVHPPAPVPVEAFRVIGDVFGWADVELVVEAFGYWWIFRYAFAVSTVGQPDVDVIDFAQVTVADEFAGPFHASVGALHATHLKNDAVTLGGINDYAAFFEGVS